MLQFVEVARLAVGHTRTLTLPWDIRQKSRFLAKLDSGEECGCLLARGNVLQDGDLLRAEDGTVARVVAAPELLSTGHTRDVGSLLRAAYHLGNRHVPVELHPTWLAYQHDHVLDIMVRELGLRVTQETLPFAPESGAYRSGHAVNRETGSHGHGSAQGGHGHGDSSHGGHSHG